MVAVTEGEEEEEELGFFEGDIDVTQSLHPSAHRHPQLQRQDSYEKHEEARRMSSPPSLLSQDVRDVSPLPSEEIAAIKRSLGIDQPSRYEVSVFADVHEDSSVSERSLQAREEVTRSTSVLSSESGGKSKLVTVELSLGPTDGAGEGEGGLVLGEPEKEYHLSLTTHTAATGDQ